LRDDIHERAEIIREAILSFEALSESLYERAGSLTVSDTPNGPLFDVHIDGQRSKGITNMQLFCFDLMLTEISRKQGRGPGFLIHDSHLLTVSTNDRSPRRFNSVPSELRPRVSSTSSRLIPMRCPGRDSSEASTSSLTSSRRS
jgi:uncharacterized protein YydD (DUF2326 family)